MMQIEEPVRRLPEVPPFALWALGFRPFYWLAAAFAALSVPLWALQVTGWLHQPYLDGALWHAHEMLFGYALAVIVGFLFTAGRNWSGRATPTGALLAAMAALWVAGRVLVLSPWPWAAAIVNVAFPLAAAAALAHAFVPAGVRRNYFFIGLMVALALASAGVHGQRLGLWQAPAWVGIQLALDMVLFIIVVMAGRVVPMFTNNGVAGAQARRNPMLETASLALVLALLAADLLQLPAYAVAALAAAAGVAHAMRLWLWQPWTTLRAPLVWVLHLAYLWIPVHLFLRATALLEGPVSMSVATHALTVGVVGCMTIGMMTRTARGHTGRPLKADRWDVSCYVLVAMAALVRVVLGWAWPAAYGPALLSSAVLWSAGMGLYAWRYWPVLSRARLDGRPG